MALETTTADPVPAPATPTVSVPSGPPTAPSALGHELVFKEVGPLRRFARAWRLARQIRGRLSKGTVLKITVGGEVPDADPPMSFLNLGASTSKNASLEAFTEGIRLAAHDPRISSLYLTLEDLNCGWARVFEMRRHLQYFASTGKSVTVYMEGGGAKEFFLAMGFELYLPPLGTLSMRGFQASGTFLRGVLDKVGVSPQVERIGKYKSAGDQISRKDMSEAQREVIQSLLDEINAVWVKSVSEVCAITEEDVIDIVNRAPWEMEEYVKAGLVTGLKYESEVRDLLKLRQQRRDGNEPEEKVMKRQFKSVNLKQYRRRTNERRLGIGGRRRIALIRANGAITSGKSGSGGLGGETIGSDTMVSLIRKAKRDKRVEALVIRCDSPGGSALASDIVFAELKRLGKPFCVSCGDVSASGGFYIAMAGEIVAENLTITGSVGVVLAKLSLGDLYKKIGYTKETLSIGKYSELLTDHRTFTEDEAAYFRSGAEIAYKSFVTKAAEARGKTYDEMHEVAQGRVWLGNQAKERGLVDHIGGLDKAIQRVKEMAGIPEDEFVRIVKIKKGSSFAQRLGLDFDEDARVRFDVDAPLFMTDVSPTLSGLNPVTRFVAASVESAIEDLAGEGALSGVAGKIVAGTLRSIFGNFEE